MHVNRDFEFFLVFFLSLWRHTEVEAERELRQDTGRFLMPLCVLSLLWRRV